ncbi:TPA: lysis protein, partial [Enterococcus faecium]
MTENFFFVILVIEYYFITKGIESM